MSIRRKCAVKNLRQHTNKFGLYIRLLAKVKLRFSVCVFVLVTLLLNTQRFACFALHLQSIFFPLSSAFYLRQINNHDERRKKKRSKAVIREKADEIIWKEHKSYEPKRNPFA